MSSHRLLLASVLIFACVASATAQEETKLSQPWLDHAVWTCEHVVVGIYARGSVTAEVELKGRLPSRTVFVGPIDRVPEGVSALASKVVARGVFFLQDRALARGEDPSRLMVWEGPAGVAWIRTGTVVQQGETVAIVESFEGFMAKVAQSLGRDVALDEAIATVESAARSERLAAIVRGAQDEPAELVADLGPDPFARQALAELRNCGAFGLAKLFELRKHPPLPWVQGAAIRLLGAVRGVPPGELAHGLEAIAQDEKASEDDVVAAIDALFHVETASLDVLEKLSHDARPRVRASVATALREKVSDLTLLERLAQDPDPKVRDRAQASLRGAAIRLAQEKKAAGEKH